MEEIKEKIYRLHKKYNFHKIFIFFLCISNIAYLSYLLIIAHHNILMQDDYWFVAKHGQHGFMRSISWWYQNWQGRFSAQILTNVIVKSDELFNSLLPYTIGLISIFIYSIARLIKQLLPPRSEIRINQNFLIFNFAIYLFNFFVIVNFEFSTFYWINASTMYFGGLAFALLGICELISNSKNIMSFFLIIIGFTYAGSSSEHFGAICTMLLATYLIILWCRKLKLKSSFKNLAMTKALLAFVFCAISFLIMIFAPGNEVRRTFYPKTSVSEALLIGLKSLFHLFNTLLAEKSKYLLILSLPFVYLGTLLREKKIVDEFRYTLMIASSIPLLIIFLYLCFLPSAYATASIGPSRSLTHIAFFIVFYVALISFIIGYRTIFPKKVALLLSLICCLFFMMISRDRIKLKLPETIKYSQSHKRRIDRLLFLKSKGTKGVVVLDSLYTSPNNVLMYYELAKDSKDIDKHWVNECISSGLKLGFEIKVK